jgi:hypothetical protein
MNQDLAQIVKYYATRSHKELNELLLEKSKNNLISVLIDLLTTYINDKNSSTLREYITVSLSGYQHLEGKIGYNGYKQSSITKGKTIKCEAKPKNYNTEGLKKYKQGERRSQPAKLNGSGNFSDYTFARLKRDIKENPSMLISGFVDGKLIYILEFFFDNKPFIDKLRQKLYKRFPKGDIPGQYLRSADFNYLNFIEANNLRIVYLLTKSELENYKDYINKKFFEFLLTCL